MKLWIGALVAILTVFVTPHAARALEPGGINCARWVSVTLEGPATDDAAIKLWLRGFIDGFRVASAARPLTAIELADIMHRLEAYCGSQPLTPLPLAAARAAGAVR